MPQKKQSKLSIIVQCAIMAALSIVLSFIKIYEAPLGGSVTLFSAAPIILISFLYGTGYGLATGLVNAVAQLLFGLGTVAYVPNALGIVLCILFDYIVPFSLIGLAGIFRNIKFTNNVKYQTLNRYTNLMLGTLMVSVIRFLCHFFTGIVVWYSLTKEGEWNDLVFKLSPAAYSAVYNGAYMVPETILLLIAVPVLNYLYFVLNKYILKRNLA